MNEMTTTEGGGKHMTVMPALTAEQVDLIKRTVCKGSTNDELALFLYTAKRTGLDPLARQIHAVKRWDGAAQREVMAIQTGIDGYRLVAERTGKYAPGDITVQMQGAAVVSATACVKKQVGDTWHEVKATAFFEEYVQLKKDGLPTTMWKKMPRLMISKCAEALALRRAFPAELSGLYTVDEMGQADSEAAAIATQQPAAQPMAKPAAKPATPAPAAAPAAQPKPEQPVQDAEVVPPAEEQQPAPAAQPAQQPAGARCISAAQGKRLYAIWKQAGKTDAEVKHHLNVEYNLGSTREILAGQQYEEICAWAADIKTNAPKAAA